MREQKDFNPELCHDLLLEKIKPSMAYNDDADYNKWKRQLREKFRELTGLDQIEQNACEPNFNIEWTEQKEGYSLTRFTFESEVGETVPCYFLVPSTGKKKYPLAIALQGHSNGFHISIGEQKYENDVNSFPRGMHAIQAVENGYAALAIEQRGMGERRPISRNRHKDVKCTYAALTAIGLGRTILGERIWDISKAIDVVEQNFPVCDTSDIIITGGSGGGTASFYAACYDERIKLCAPVCSFCSYKESILSIAHCSCNYIPFSYKYFDMHDLAALIAPRKLAIVTGKLDEIFPINGVERSYEVVKKIYARAGVPNNCSLSVTEEGHRWINDIVWDAINKIK